MFGHDYNFYDVLDLEVVNNVDCFTLGNMNIEMYNLSLDFL